MNRKLQKFERIYNECSDNVIKFLQIFLKIELTSFQKSNLLILDNSNYICLPRQGGKTFIASSVCLHNALYNANSHIVITSIDLEDSKNTIEVIKSLIASLPEIIKKEITKITKTEIHFSNGSKIFTVPNSETNFRGKHIDLLIIENADFIDQEIEDGIIFNLKPNTRVIKTITA